MGFFSRTKKLKMLESISKKTQTKRIIQFCIGCLLVAISYNLFLAPNKLVAGGVSGLATILKAIFGVEEYIVILISN